MTNFEKVGIFMKTFGQEVKTNPSLSTDKINELRINLINEELDELKVAMIKKDLVEIADALGDKLYILCGTILAHGLQDKIVEVFNEIQRSNMSKLSAEGKPVIREDGKILKGPNYFKPNIKSILEK